MIEVTRGTGIDVAQLDWDMTAHADDIARLIKRNLTIADAIGLQGTPGFLVGTFKVNQALNEQGFVRGWWPTRARVKRPSGCEGIEFMSGRFLGRRLRLVLPVCALATVLAGCSVTGGPLATAALSPIPSSAMAHYAVLGSEKFPVDAVDTSRHPRFLKQVVAYSSPYAAGTIVVDPHNRFLYLIRKDGQAVRYGVGVGREGLAFAGTGTVQEKQEWPHWTPTNAMIAREPKRYAKWASGMKGGTGNPLGARSVSIQGWKGHALSHSRDHRAGQHRQSRVIWFVIRYAEPGRHRSLFPGAA